MRTPQLARRLVGLVGAAALVGGLALGAGVGVGVYAQTTATPTAAPTVSGPTPASNLGGPSSVPSARFYGTVTGANGSVVPTGTTVTATIGGVACGFGTVTNSQYIVDVQAISGCTAPGATVHFAVGGVPATQTGTLPNVEGTAVQLNLTVAAPTPTPAPTTATVPPPPPPPAPTTPRPTTVTATATPRPSTPAAQVPSAQRPSAPAAQKPAGVPVAQRPGAAAPAPAARPYLPNTGTGGAQGSGAGLALLGILLGAVALSATGLVTYRRAR